MPATIRAEISAPEVVYLPTDKRKATVELDVLARILNDGDESFVVGSEDEAHAWHVLTESAREIGRSTPGKGKEQSHVHSFTSQLVAAGQSHNDPGTLVLDAKKLKPGQRYTIRYSFHGYTAETTFTAVAGHAATAKKATANKAPAKKKAPARKAAAKKAPAKKAPAKRKAPAKKAPAKRKR